MSTGNPCGTATIWVETDRPCTAEVRCEGGAHGSSRTFLIAGHHYALIPVTGLTPGTTVAYEVLLDEVRVWPPADSPFPPSVIRTPAAATPDTATPGTGTPGTGTPELHVSFGSCRWASAPVGEPDPVGPDALHTLAAALTADPGAVRPDVLILLGDQVYADETSKATRRMGSPGAAIWPSRRARRSPTSRSTPTSTTSRGAIPRSAGCSPPCRAA